MTRRILHVIDSLRLGGMERILVSLTNALAERGHEQTICTLRDGGPLTDCLPPGVECVELRSRGRHWALPARLRDLVRKYNVDVVHGQNVGTWCDTIRAAAGRAPLVQSFHGFLEADTSSFRRTLHRWLAARTDCLTTVTATLRPALVRRFSVSPERIHVVENGIDSREFAPAARGKAEQALRSQCGGRILCVTCASLTPAKSPDTLIDAARLLPDDVAFAWVGDGPLESETRVRIERAGLQHRFHLLGLRLDVRSILRAADLFVLPSKTEAHPLSVLEAMAAGLPIVATRAGGIPDMVEAPRAGLLCEPGDAAGVATNIRRLSEDEALRTRMAVAARQHAVERFSLERMADRYESIYERVTQDAKRACAAGAFA